MDDFEEWMRKSEMIDGFERRMFFKKVRDTITDGELIYNMLCDKVSKRFKLTDRYAPTWRLVNYYFDCDVSLDFCEWLYCEDAPLLIRLSDIGKLFPELKPFCKSNRKMMELANKVYGLELKLDYDELCDSYVYAYEFNFNGFTPINLDRVKELKTEIEFCKKYGLEYAHLSDELGDFGLDESVLEVL